MICPHCGNALSMRVSEEQRKEIVKLTAQGFLSRDIQSQTGVSFSSVARIMREEKRKKKP